MEQLIAFLRIDDLARQQAQAAWTLIEAAAEAIVRDFYADLHRYDSDLIDAAMIDHLTRRQVQHWKALLAGELDQDYFNAASLVGIKHREIGLDPKWYIAGYHRIKHRLNERILATQLPVPHKIGLVMTLDRFVALDMALALSSYSSWLVD